MSVKIVVPSGGFFDHCWHVALEFHYMFSEYTRCSWPDWVCQRVVWSAHRLTHSFRKISLFVCLYMITENGCGVPLILVAPILAIPSAISLSLSPVCASTHLILISLLAAFPSPRGGNEGNYTCVVACRVFCPHHWLDVWEICGSTWLSSKLSVEFSSFFEQVRYPDLMHLYLNDYVDSTPSWYVKLDFS